jgi:hypothetical protein
MWNLASVRLEMVLVSVEGVRFVRNFPLAQKSFWTHLMVLLGDKLKWKLTSVCLEIVLILRQDRCSVCTERTIPSKSFRRHPMVLLGDEAKEKARFSSFGDSINLNAR